MSATFDATTTAEYAAATTAADRSAVIVAALTGTISVKVFNASNVEKGSGTMTAPWATASGATVTVGEVSSFTVGGTATPDANWYIRFQNADVSRWVRGSFGLSDSGQDFTWSLATWEAGQTGTIGTATILTTGNSAPVFTVAPTTANIVATGGTIQFTAVDPEGSTVTYSMSYRNGFTINPTTGLVTITAAAAGTSGNITVTASDGVLSTPAVCNVTVDESINLSASFVVTTSAATQTTGAITVSVRRVSDGRVFTYTSPAFSNANPITITRSAIGAQAGAIIEFAGGTYPSMKWSGFSLGSRTNRTIFRNKSGEIATIRRQGNTGTDRNFVWIFSTSKYVTIDGSNGFPDWYPWLPTGNYGFRLTYAAEATLANPDRGASSHLKLSDTATTMSDEFVFKRVEIIGGYFTGYASYFSGGISSNMVMKRSTSAPYVWQECIEVTECYAHGGTMQLCYIGSNWIDGEIPLRGAWVHHNCSEDTLEDGFTCKSWIAHAPTEYGLPENAIHHNHVRRTGWNTEAGVNQRCGFSLMQGTANIYNNYTEDAGSGRTPYPESGVRPNGIAIGCQDIVPGFTYGSFVLPPLLIRIYNNVCKDNQKSGINATRGTGAAPMEIYVYQNTCVSNLVNGIGMDSDVGHLVKNNVCLENVGSQISAATQNNNLTGELISTYLNANLTLKAAQPIAAGSVLNESKAETDFNDIVRVTPDKGAYEYI